MNVKSLGRIIVWLVVVAGLAIAVAGGCHGTPKDTVKQVSIGSVKLQATGAGIVQADGQKTSFKIKCAVCGYETDVKTINTPTPGKPYTLDWVCPRCGHKQKIVIAAVAK